MKHLLLGLLLTGGLSATAQAPYTITLKKAANQPAPALQSFCIATEGNLWLLVGGRTNGFHGTYGSGASFPTSESNKKLWVVDVAGNKSWSADVPDNLLYQLSSTNIPFWQVGNTLYLTGGYGANCQPDSCYQTFQQVTAIDVQRTIAAVQNRQQISNYIKTINDSRMQVTGGYLTYLRNSLLLVMGQNYPGKYTKGAVGKYTEQIARFTIDNSGRQPVVTSYNAVTTQQQYNGANQFHRRDFPSVTMVMPNDRSVGIGVFGGVFNNQGGAFVNPVYVLPMGLGTNTVIDTFVQRYCVYDCATISAFNSANNQAYVSFIGGITDWTIDDQGNEVPPYAANFMPWFNRVSTIVKTTSGTREYPQTTSTLPGYIGANAAFILAPNIPLFNGTTEVIDYAKLSSGSTMIGWMYGGIEATAEQSNSMNPTNASGTVYEVWLQKN